MANGNEVAVETTFVREQMAQTVLLLNYIPGGAPAAIAATATSPTGLTIAIALLALGATAALTTARRRAYAPKVM